MTKTNTPEIYVTQILHKSSSRVSRHRHSETESELTELTIYISMADYSLVDSANFCLFLELFFFSVLPIIPEIIREQSQTIDPWLHNQFKPEKKEMPSVHNARAYLKDL